MGMPAARVGDMHACPMVTVLVPHVGGPVLPPCAVTVLTGNMPQARIGDICVCVGPPDVIAMGAFTVLVSGRPAARIGDLTAHGGTIVMGWPTVLIGDNGSGSGGGSGGGVGALRGAPSRTDAFAFSPWTTSSAQGKQVATNRAARRGTPFVEQCRT